MLIEIIIMLRTDIKIIEIKGIIVIVNLIINIMITKMMTILLKTRLIQSF